MKKILAYFFISWVASITFFGLPLVILYDGLREVFVLGVGGGLVCWLFVWLCWKGK